MRPTRRAMLTWPCSAPSLMAGIGASLPAAAATSADVHRRPRRLRRRSAAQAAATRRDADARLSARAQGLRGADVVREGRRDRRLPNVRFVEPDGIATISVTQSPATWGLDRIDQRNLPLNNSYVVHADRRRRDGLHPRHGHAPHAQRFRRARHRAASTRSTTTRRQRLPRPRHARRRHGRRDDVRRREERRRSSPSASSTAAAAGPGTQVISGVDWVTGDHGPGELAVANMSLGGGGTSLALETAVDELDRRRRHYALAAGNNNANACNYSPARTPNAITIGATSNHRRPLVVLELRHVPRPLRARRRTSRRRSTPATHASREAGAARRWRRRTPRGRSAAPPRRTRR